MKGLLQVLLHGLAALAGFWLMSGEVASSPEGVAPAGKSAGKPALPPSAIAKDVRQRGVMLKEELSPVNWPEEITVISAMQVSELPGALQRCLGCRFPDVRRRLMRLLFERWAVLDRAGALAALGGISSPQMKAYALDAVLREWVKTDEAAAWQHVISLHEDGVLQEESIQTLLTLCAGKSPTNYVAWARQLEDPFLRGKVLDSISQAWARAEPPGALEAAFAEEDPYLREKLFTRLSYENKGGKGGIDCARTLDRFLELPDAAERARLLRSNWVLFFANEQRAEALRWLQGHGDRPELQTASSMVGTVMADQVRDVAEIRAAALSLPAGPMRDAFAASAAGSWAARGHPIPEAEALLALCGPCIERERAVEAIREAEMRR